MNIIKELFVGAAIDTIERLESRISPRQESADVFSNLSEEELDQLEAAHCFLGASEEL